MARLKTVGPRLKLAAPALARRSGFAAVDPSERFRRRDVARPNWYKTARWQRLRRARLDHDKWVCAQTGTALNGIYPAWNSAAVDHIEPHRWDPELFWAWDNLQSVTKEWHDSEKQKLERAGLA